MSVFSFGEFKEGIPYKVLNERSLRASSGLMFLAGIIAFIYAFILQEFIVVTYISGFLLLNFAIGVFINPKFMPTMFLSWIFVRKQTPLWVGAIQKRFAWSLGLMLSLAIFTLSFKLLTDISYFDPICMMCLLCLVLLFFETAFGICIGCKIYFLGIRLKLIKKPKVMPNCIGDTCEIEK